ncbi:MAG: alpha/beta hydrolase [Desulfobacula sp.]|nr:alpha/beta hydrolase [Desulfobacula sp.]
MAESIVMVHGMWGGPWCWEKFQPFFENKGYQCHVPALRHHDILPGDLPPGQLGTTSLLDYVQDLENYIEKMSEKPIIMGHSMGGLLVQMLAQRNLATKTIMLAPAPPAGIHALSYSVFKCFLSMFSTWGFWKKPHRIPFKTAKFAFLHQLSASQQKEQYNRLVYEAGQAASEIGLWLLDPNKASCVDETKITCPQLIIGASSDRIVPAAVVRKVAAKYHQTADYKEFEKHSHWLIGEDGWELVAEYVAKWIENKS